MSMARTWLRPVAPASGTSDGTPAPVDDYRRALQISLPYGAMERIARRMGTSAHVVRDQVEGSHRLSLPAWLESLREVPQAVARELAGEALAPLGLVVMIPGRPDDTIHGAIAEETRKTASVVASLAEALSPTSPGGTVVTRDEAMAALPGAIDNEAAARRLVAVLNDIANGARP